MTADHAVELKIVDKVFAQGALTDARVAELGLNEVRNALTKASKGGIQVNFKLYRNTEDVFAAGATTPFDLFLD